MCGIAGFIDLNRGVSATDGAAALQRMADRLKHRGPDDWGTWSDPQNGVFFAHRRLSIVDLSPAGHQPMASASGRYVVVFNGEIYNHRSLRMELEATGFRGWRGHSDTEVLLAAFEVWGVLASLSRLVGMFAIALWDKRELALTLIRDRAGEKPLYFGRMDRQFVFTSELGAVESLAQRSLAVNESALPLLMRYGYIPAPHSIYADVEKLLPASWIRLSTLDGAITRGAYWSAHDSVQGAAGNQLQLSDADCVDELERLIGDAVKLQLEADVPVGAFLSGGIDSSTVVALAQKHASSPVRTFSIGFDQDGFDESHHARLVARHLGTQHTELQVSARDALDVVPLLSKIYDEPFADASQIPTYLVAKLAKLSVTVALTGDGGDELFCGYPRYDRAQKLIRTHEALPAAARKLLSSSIQSLSPANWTRIASAFGHQRESSAHRTVGDRLHRIAQMLRNDKSLIYCYLASSLPQVSRLIPGCREPSTLFDSPGAWPTGVDENRLAMWMDFMVYLPDDMLAKVDRASMAVSLETRVPLLDHRVIEFSHRLPRRMLARDGIRKWALRQVLYRHVPRELIDRPKMGFSMPLGVWLRGPLREWAESLLFAQNVQADQIDPIELRRLWTEHQSGARDWHQTIWSVLMLRDWHAGRCVRCA